MALDIRTLPAQIGIQTSPGEMQLRQKPASLQITTQQPLITIENSFVQVTIDQRKPFSEAGLKSVMDWAFDATQRARQAVSSYAGKTTDQGNEMADFHKGGDAVAEQSDYNAFGQFSVDYNVESVPKSKPDIDFVDGKAVVDIQPGKVEIEVERNAPDINIQKNVVEVYLKQKNSITITPLFDGQV